MTSVKSTVAALLVLAGLTGSAMAGPVTIADYSADYLATSQGQTRAAASADGWNYMYCPTSGAMGTPANYVSLQGTGVTYFDYTAGGQWTSEVAGNEYLYIGKGNSPGLNTGLTGDSFAIAAYTIQAGEGGAVSIANGFLYNDGEDGNGIELRVYVNNILKIGGDGTAKIVVTHSTPITGLGYALGTLTTGDTVYVAIGNNGATNFDDYHLGYQLTIPEPASLALLGLGALALLRRRRN
jgi:hypothetical protein